MRKLFCIIIASCFFCLTTRAQVGDYRNRISVGVGGGYILNKMSFVTAVPQTMLGGMTAGVSFRYTSEKYFSMLCAIQAEINYTQKGWKEKIETYDNGPVINPQTGVAEAYQRRINYFEIPVFAHLSWGKENKGLNVFVNLGPQIGFFTGESTKKNYDIPYTKANTEKGAFAEEGITTFSSHNGRISIVEAQEKMPVEKKIDYGITLGAGVEATFNHVGRFDLEGRFYYGLGNIYGDSKKDYFGASNHTTVYIKLSYFYDLNKNKH